MPLSTNQTSPRQRMVSSAPTAMNTTPNTIANIVPLDISHHPVSDLCPARKQALLTLVEVDKKAAFVNLALRELLRLKRLPAKERGMATALALGAVKMRLYIDYLLSQVCAYPLDELPVFIRNILRLATYELVFYRHPAPIVGNEYVKLAKRFGHEGTAALVNG